MVIYRTVLSKYIKYTPILTYKTAILQLVHVFRFILDETTDFWFVCDPRPMDFSYGLSKPSKLHYV